MYLIIDLEATCWQFGNPLYGQNEIIEIGAVVLDVNGDELGDVQRFVKPVTHPVLSEFCTELTSISQADVEAAEILPAALNDFKNEVETLSQKNLSDLLFCSWGDYDRKQLLKECRSHSINYPFGIHRNVKREFAAKQRIRPVGIPKALRILNMPFEGTYHRGIDDARNIAKIFRHQLNDRMETDESTRT